VLAALRNRPALAHPIHGLNQRATEIAHLRATAQAALERGLDRKAADLHHLRARLTTLGPAATLARGYAVVQQVPDHPQPGAPLPVLRSVHETGPGARLRIRVADGAVAAIVEEDR
jgi:exodeoxyribonuclease VII large subunit